MKMMEVVYKHNICFFNELKEAPTHPAIIRGNNRRNLAIPLILFNDFIVLKLIFSGLLILCLEM